MDFICPFENLELNEEEELDETCWKNFCFFFCENYDDLEQILEIFWDFGKIWKEIGIAKIKNVLIPDVQNCRQDF